MIFYLPLVASSMFNLNTPQDQRLETLKPFFQPAAGAEIFVSQEDASLAARGKIPVKKLRGYITVSPPRNTCFAIKRNEASPDEHICGKKTLVFTLADMDRAGKLTWNVKTSPDDIGTQLSWQTPYRIAILMPRTENKKNTAEFWKDTPPLYKFIKSCTDVSIPSTRRIELKIFTGESWLFYFPEVHKLLPQPEEAPNLVIANTSSKRSITDAANEKKEAAAKKHDSADEPEKKGDPEKGDANPKDDRPDNFEDRKLWTISLRDSYEMSVENFHADNLTTSGLKGKCRYNFTGPPEDPTTGRIECQDTPEFHMFLLPVTCLSKVKGDRVRP